MARNLFLLASLAVLAGCQTPSQPPSPSGLESATVTAPAAPAVDAAPAAAPASNKLPLGPVRRK